MCKEALHENIDIEHNTGVWVGKPDCSEMEMTQFIFISGQSGFPAHSVQWINKQILMHYLATGKKINGPYINSIMWWNVATCLTELNVFDL